MRRLSLILLILLAGCKVQPNPTPIPEPGPLPPGPTPIVKTDTGLDDVSDPSLSEFYAAFADVLARDQTDATIKTTGQFRAVNITAGTLRFKATDRVKNPDLAKKVDAYLLEKLGKEDKAFEYDAAIKALKQLSEALK